MSAAPKKNTSNSKINQAVAAELRGERAAAGLTIEGLAAASGVALSTLKRILSGAIDVNVADLALLCKALGVAQGRELTPADVFEHAVERVGGYDVLYAEIAAAQTPKD